MEAIEALKEAREINAPSVYDDSLLDSLGYYNVEQDSIRKKRMIDSVYFLGQKRYENIAALKQLEENYSDEPKEPIHQVYDISEIDTSTIEEKELQIRAKEIGLEHQLFFASNPEENVEQHLRNTDEELRVRVDGTQTVKQDYRLRMRLSNSAKVDGITLDKNTLLYGFVSFKPNRTLLRIEQINGRNIPFEAFDLDDGSKGIYIENSFQEEIRKQVVGDVVDDINLAGVPQVSGVKQLFIRSNQQVKVTVMDNYQLILKLKQ